VKVESRIALEDRESKAEYLYSKYKDIFKGKVLDVGADQCFLKQHLRQHHCLE